MPTRLRWMRFRPQEAALIAITAVWGSTFLLVHWAMQHSGPWFFVGLRFLVAGLSASSSSTACCAASAGGTSAPASRSAS